MRHLATVFVFCVLPAWALAQGDAAKLTAEELKALLPGTKVTHHSKEGSLRRWTNNSDGNFVASSDNKKFGSALGTSSRSAPGTWRVSDEGKYCIAIEWGRVSENWCAFVLKTAGGEFYLNEVEPSRKIEFAQ